jgi:hypothetical protein
VFYAVTLAPTVVWGDSAALSLNVFHGHLRLTRASDHPLFVLVGRLFASLPGELARNVNLVSAVFGALTVMLVYRCGRQLGASRLAAGAGAAALSVSHAFWLHAVVAEVYTANAFFLVATLTLLLDWRQRQDGLRLAAAVVLFGVGLTNHLVLGTAAPALAIFIAARTRARPTRGTLTVLAAACGGGAGLALAAPQPVWSLLRSFWVGPPGISEFFSLPNPGDLLTEAGYYVLFLVYQFPSIGLGLGILGALALLRTERPVAWLLLGIVVVNAGVFIRHTVWPSGIGAKYVFYIADYAVFSILCAVGAEEFLRRMVQTRRIRPATWGVALLGAVALVPPAAYAVAPSAAQALGLDLIRASSIPYRDAQRFFLNPNKRGEVGARRFGVEALATAAPGAVIFADYTPYTVLSYLQVVEGRRPDVLLQSAPGFGLAVPVRWEFDNGRRRPTYLATLTPGYYDLQGLGAHKIAPAGPIFEVRPR